MTAHLPQWIRDTRLALGLSQEGLSKRLGVSFTSVNRWENGKTAPSRAAVKRLQALADKTPGCQRPPNVALSQQQPLIAYAFFAGGGGLHRGFECSAITVAVATDISPAAEATHRLNWPTTPFVTKDIRRLTAKELIRLAGGKRPDIVFGGPPCQGFSTLGDKQSADPKNLLFDAYARLVGELDPRCVIIENVKAMTTMYGGRYADQVVQAFRKLGYTVYREVLDAAAYGVPQHRERVIFIATKCNTPFAFPPRTHGSKRGLKAYKTVGPAIMDLAPLGEADSPNHVALTHSETVVGRYKRVPEGGRLPPPEKLPKNLRRKNFGNTYKRLHRKRPSLTMVPGNNAFPIHPTLNRSLTPREAARLQTFPDSHLFAGSRREQCILVGNAVPPLFAEAIRDAVLSHMRGRVNASSASRPHHDDAAISTDCETELGIKALARLPESEGYVDLFSGAGGFTIGLARAGWRPLLSVDLNKHVRETHESAFPSIPFHWGDISQAEVRQSIADRFAGKSIAIVAGGPPCQGFSIFGKRRFVNTRGYDPHDDPRNKLVYAFIDVVRRLKPRWFIMENVKGFTSLDGGRFLEAVLAELRSCGYGRVEARVLNAANYGVPQLRERLLIIGNSTGHIIPWPKRKFFECPEDWQKPYRTVGEVITDLASPASYSSHSCHRPMKHKPLLVQRYGFIPEGGKLNVDALPRHLRIGYRTDEVKNYSNIFRRLHRDHPAVTMVPGHNAFPIHPWLDRALTVREAARIQTFPDSLEFKGPRQEQCIQVGNAFPPLLAELLASNIRKAERNVWLPGSVPASALYSLVEAEPATDPRVAQLA